MGFGAWQSQAWRFLLRKNSIPILFGEWSETNILPGNRPFADYPEALGKTIYFLYQKQWILTWNSSRWEKGNKKPAFRRVCSLKMAKKRPKVGIE
jgi:hypothetical protein